MKRVFPASFAVVSILVACGGGRIPAVGPDRDSGQSGLMDKTFAGGNKCNPKNHERPFVIEWDATDMSQFEALTSSDIVFVKYQGCDLKVVDTCKNDSVKGQLGSYRAVDWTSGSVEKIDITNEGELYAKLPLGVATLGARVSAGEAFRMEYFVSGTRSATRPAQYKADLDKIPGCKGVTHFVYAFNLGAFALGSNKNVKGEANATFWGMGAGGSSKYASAAEKKGGLLASCRGESAKEIQTCQTPIRLTLRELEDSENPDAKAAIAPETPDAKNLAGKVDAERKLEGKAKELMASATEKYNARDGKGCLSSLDAYDRLASGTDLSTNPKTYFAITRAQCLMAAGQCDPGKLLLRKWAEGQRANFASPEQVDNYVSAIAARNCQGASMSPRDQVLKAKQELMQSSQPGKVELSVCRNAYDTIRRLRKTVKTDENDMASTSPDSYSHFSVQCFAKAKDCQSAWNAARELAKERAEDKGFPYTPQAPAGSVVDAGCHAKDIATLSPHERVLVAARDLDRLNNAKVESSACRESYENARSAAASLKNDKEQEAQGAVMTWRKEGLECFLKAGDCNAAWAVNKENTYGDQADTARTLTHRWRTTGSKCRTKDISGLTPGEKLGLVAQDLSGNDKKEVSECKASIDLGRSAAASTTPGPETDGFLNELQRNGTSCLVKAGDCASARKTFMDLGKMGSRASRSGDPDALLARQFESQHRECKDK